MELPPEIGETILGTYFQSIRYTDEAIGKFIKKLDREGILKDSEEAEHLHESYKIPDKIITENIFQNNLSPCHGLCFRTKSIHYLLPCMNALP